MRVVRKMGKAVKPRLRANGSLETPSHQTGNTRAAARHAIQTATSRG
jgi:hypothetical protein